MKTVIRKVLKSISIAGNVLFLLLLAVSLFTKKPLVFNSLDMGSSALPYTSAACIVSVPGKGADVSFGAPSFSLKTGEEALLQFSVYQSGQQMNVAVNVLYDHEIIAVGASGYGIIIRALKAGVTVMQVFSSDGVRDIARVTVSE